MRGRFNKSAAPVPTLVPAIRAHQSVNLGPMVAGVWYTLMDLADWLNDVSLSASEFGIKTDGLYLATFKVRISNGTGVSTLTEYRILIDGSLVWSHGQFSPAGTSRPDFSLTDLIPLVAGQKVKFQVMAPTIPAPAASIIAGSEITFGSLHWVGSLE